MTRQERKVKKSRANATRRKDGRRVPETEVSWNGVEGVPRYPDGEGRHERWQVKNSRRQSDAPGEEGEEIRSPKREK